MVLNRSQQNSVPKSIPSIHFIDLNVQQPSMMFIKLIVSVKSSLHCLLLVDCANCAELRALLVPCQIRERRQSIFELRGLCERLKTSTENYFKACIGLDLFRTALDTKYVLLNDAETGLSTYVGNFP